MASFEVGRLHLFDKVAAGAGAVLLVCLFLPFYTVSVLAFSQSLAGREAGFLSWAGLLLGVAAGALALLPALDVAWPSSAPVTRRVAVLALAAVSTLMLVLRLLVLPDGFDQAGALGADAGRSVGLFVAVLAAVALLVAAVLAFRDSGEALPTRESLSRRPATDPPTTPPTATPPSTPPATPPTSPLGPDAPV